MKRNLPNISSLEQQGIESPGGTCCNTHPSEPRRRSPRREKLRSKRKNKYPDPPDHAFVCFPLKTEVKILATPQNMFCANFPELKKKQEKNRVCGAKTDPFLSPAADIHENCYAVQTTCCASAHNTA